MRRRALTAAALAAVLAATAAAETYRGIEVAPERRCSPYDPDDYTYPQSVEQRILDDLDGLVYGPYTGTCFAHRGQTDIEHVVARSEAHDSGLCARDAATRAAFARDPLNLTLASPAVNRHRKGRQGCRRVDARAQRVLVRRTDDRGTAGIRPHHRRAGGGGGGAGTGRLPLDGHGGVVRHDGRGAGGGVRRCPRRRPDALRRQRERADHLRGSAPTRHRAGAARPSSVPVHARRRRRRRRLRVRRAVATANRPSARRSPAA